jgi:hypothetical protein
MKKKRPKTRRVTDEELLPYMDYLHGDVIGGQFRAACQYEYARESSTLRRAAELHRREPTPYAGEIVFQTGREFHRDSWFISTDWMFVWQCPSFPAKNWNQLSENERTELLHGLTLSTTEARPLRLAEVVFLTRVFDQFKDMAEGARAKMKQAIAARKPRQKAYPVLEVQNTPLVHALLPLDFSKSKQRLLQEIDLWLELPENKARFDKHRPRTEAGTEKQAKDRLKDLAAWKLFRELGWDGALEFAEQHREHDKSGEPRAFHDPRQGRKERGQLKKVPPNQAPLYSWQTGESAFRKAKVRVDRYLAELIPWEFGEYAEEVETLGREMVERFKEALKKPQKTSTNSS